MATSYCLEILYSIVASMEEAVIPAAPKSSWYEGEAKP